MGAAAAVIIRKEREIVEIYRAAGATKPATARDPADLDIHHRLAFNLLVRRAVLREAGDGRYYLDEPSWKAMRAMRQRMLIAVILVIMLLLAVSIGSGALGVGMGLARIE